MASRPAVVAQPVSLKSVDLTGGFWKIRQDANRNVTLPLELEQCTRTGRIAAFKLDWKPGAPNKPHNFWDSDIAKWIEAAAYSLAKHPDPALEKQVDEVVALIVAAQQPDGYLNVFYSVVEPGKRWTNLRDMHELYCAGHLMEGAVAYHKATGKRDLLDCLCRYADHIAATFGPRPGQKRGYCGHPEVELGLMKLFRATGKVAYRDLAAFFVTERGQSANGHYYDIEARERNETGKPWAEKSYYQADKPLIKQNSIEGHAVRALYLLSGAIDVAAETGDAKLFAACKRLFDNCVNRRMYITGAVGSARHGERFTYDYDLPNETAYAETCANIALALAAHRMLHVEPDGRYADIMERALYNGVVSGVSLKGDKFYYANPLAVADEAMKTAWGVISARRQEWFDCACCPPNIARLLGEVNEMFYSTTPDTVMAHLYGDTRAVTTVACTQVTITQKTGYPWDGVIHMAMEPTTPARFTLKLRIPAWCGKWSVSVNGRKISARPQKGYIAIGRLWQMVDHVELKLALDVQVIETNPRCRNNAGKVAIQRGPIVYCAEETDNGADLTSYVVPLKTKWTTQFAAKRLGGITVITGKVLKGQYGDWDGQLYRAAGKTKLRPTTLTLVPYCVWSNRKVGRMQVWLNGR